MATYLGKVVIQNNYYNYTPVAELSGKTFVQLSENEVDRLLPASSKRNINLSYSFFDDAQVKFIYDIF